MDPNDDIQSHTVTSQIRANNNNEVNWDTIKESNTQQPVANDYHKIMNKIDQKYMTPEQREQKKNNDDIGSLREEMEELKNAS